MMNIRNAVYLLDGRIDCEINHPQYGWIPFTASPDDPEPHGRAIFEALKDSAAPYVPRDPKDVYDKWRESAVMSRNAFVQACLAADILSPSDAVVAAKGDWPEAFNPALDGLTEKEAASAQVDWAAAQSVMRSHPMFARIVDAGLATDEQIDALFGWSDD